MGWHEAEVMPSPPLPIATCSSQESWPRGHESRELCLPLTGVSVGPAPWLSNTVDLVPVRGTWVSTLKCMRAEGLTLPPADGSILWPSQNSSRELTLEEAADQLSYYPGQDPGL